MICKMWPFKKYLFNVRISSDAEDASRNNSFAKDLAGKTVSIREDGTISYRARRKLETYDAEMDLDPPTLGFPGERPVIEPPFSLFSDFAAMLGSHPLPERAVTTVLIEKTRPGKYKLDLSRFTD